MSNTQPNTPAILTAIQGICQGLQVSGSTFFLPANVAIGKYKDVTNQVPCCEITLAEDLSARLTAGGGATLGGKINDAQTFMIEVTLDMTDSIAVETQLAQIRDSLTFAFHQSATLNTSNVRYSGWHTEKGVEGYSDRNGAWWRMYRRKLYVEYDYTALMKQ